MNDAPELQRIRWVPCLNVSGEIIPAWAAMKFSSWAEGDDDSGGIISVAKPDGLRGVALINGPHAIQIGDYGACTYDFPAQVLCDGSPTNGQIWGPAEDSWELIKDKHGFWILAAAGSGTAIVVPEPGRAEVVRVTGAAVGGVYPGVIERYDGTTPWVDAEAIDIIEINGANLSGWSGGIYNWGTN